jgi:hypothetical protein
MNFSNPVCVTSAILFVAGAVTSFGFVASGGGTVEVPNTFVAGTTARASEVNANFQALRDGVNDNSARIDQNSLLIDDLSQSVAFRIVVAKSGGDFTTIEEALASIDDAAADRPYRVVVAPGVFDESGPLVVPAFVSLTWSGAGTTVVRRAAAGSTQNSDAAVITVEDSAQVADLSVHNTGSGSAFSLGVLGFALSDATRIERVDVLVDGAGGNGHFAFLFGDSDLLLRDCVGRASGGTVVSTGFGSTDSGGPFAQMRIERCRFEGNSGSGGFGMQLSQTAADVFDCDIFGSGRAISTSVAGGTEIQGSKLRSFQAVAEQTGSAALLMANTMLIGNNPVGISSQFRYVHCFKANYLPVVDGDGSSIQ